MGIKRLYLDTEFNERPSTIELLSIGLCDDDDNRLYAVNSEADHDAVNPWVKENVLPHLGTGHDATRGEIASMVLDFTSGYQPEFWGYYCDYDWVVFCWLFGSMIDLPKGYPMYCKDIQQLSDDLGDPELPEQSGMEHNALSDALWNRTAFHFLDDMKNLPA